MKERLIQLLDLEQLSPSKFADLIGVQRSSISHIISGRNKPSFDFLQKTLRAFPGLNASWLLLGEGSMYEQMGRRVSGNLFDAQAQPEVPLQDHIPGSSVTPGEILQAEKDEVAENEPEAVPGPSENMQRMQMGPPEEQEGSTGGAQTKRIVQVMVFYGDDTFRTYRPAH